MEHKSINERMIEDYQNQQNTLDVDLLGVPEPVKNAIESADYVIARTDTTILIVSVVLVVVTIGIQLFFNFQRKKDAKNLIDTYLRSAPEFKQHIDKYFAGEDFEKLVSEKYKKQLVENWLAEYKFHNWQGKTTNQKKERAREIASSLSDFKKWHTHGRPLNINHLQDLRLKITNYTTVPKFTELDSLIREYRHTVGIGEKSIFVHSKDIII